MSYTVLGFSKDENKIIVKKENKYFFFNTITNTIKDINLNIGTNSIVKCLYNYF